MREGIKIIRIAIDDDIRKAADKLLTEKVVFVQMVEDSCAEKAVCFLTGVTYIFCGDIKIYDSYGILSFKLRQKYREIKYDDYDFEDEFNIYDDYGDMDDSTENICRDVEVEFNSQRFSYQKSLIDQLEGRMLEILDDQVHLERMAYGSLGDLETLRGYIYEDFQMIHEKIREYAVSEIISVMYGMINGNSMTVKFDNIENNYCKMLYNFLAGGCYAFGGKIEKVEDNQYKFINDADES